MSVAQLDSTPAFQAGGLQGRVLPGAPMFATIYGHEQSWPFSVDEGEAAVRQAGLDQGHQLRLVVGKTARDVTLAGLRAAAMCA